MRLSPIIIAADFCDIKSMWRFIDHVDATLCRIKIGQELFSHAGPTLLKKLQKKGFDIFLDLKFHDIPNTVARAVKVAADLGVWMVDIHAAGGQRMMEAAKNALSDYGQQGPLLVAVTVLTSMKKNDLEQIGIKHPILHQVTRLATIAKECGLDGVVCSAEEAQSLRAELGHNFKLVTPGIRPLGSSSNDQRRIMTPQQALALGSDYLVIGRPITQAANPGAILNDILSSIRVQQT